MVLLDVPLAGRSFRWLVDRSVGWLVVPLAGWSFSSLLVVSHLLRVLVCLTPVALPCHSTSSFICRKITVLSKMKFHGIPNDAPHFFLFQVHRKDTDCPDNTTVVDWINQDPEYLAVPEKEWPKVSKFVWLQLGVHDQLCECKSGKVRNLWCFCGYVIWRDPVTWWGGTETHLMMT